MMRTTRPSPWPLPNEHRRTLIAEAGSARLARAARDGRDVSAVRPTRWFLPLPPTRPSAGRPVPPPHRTVNRYHRRSKK